MSDLDKVLAALERADAAGNVEDARELAAIAKSMQQGVQPQSAPEAATVSDPLPQGGSIADPIAQGMTFGFMDEIKGVDAALNNKIAGLFGGGTDEAFGDTYSRVRDEFRGRNEAFSERNPKTAIAGEIGGGLLTGGVGAVKAGVGTAVRNAPSFLSRMLPIAKTGAVQGGLYGAGTSEAETAQGVAGDTLRGAGIGAATAPILPALASGGRSTVSRMFNTDDSAVFKRSVELLRDKVPGLKLTTSQKTGSSPLRSAEETLGETLVGGRIARQLDNNRAKLQTKLMQMAGFDMASQDVIDGKVTQQAIDAAADKFSKRYTQLLGGKSISLDTEDFVDAISDVQAKHYKLLPAEQRRQISEIVDQLFDEATSGPQTASSYNRIRSFLGSRERASANNPVLANLYRDLKHSIDDGIADALGFAGRKSAIDKRYNRFAKIRDTFESVGGVSASKGDMPLSSLLRRSAKRGKGADRDFTDMVRAAQTVLGDPTPNSATASRLGNMAILGEGVATAGGLIDPVTSSIVLGLPFSANQMLSRGVTGNSGVNAAINSGLLSTPALAPLLINPEQD